MGYPVFSDEYFMNEALKEARKAAEMGEVPVGAVIVCNNMVIARGHNLTEQLNDVTAHAEMQVITSAAESLGGKYLTGCTLYVTLEPCLMCGGALYWSQISGIVYGASDIKRGFDRFKKDVIHPKCVVKSGVLESECSAVVKAFFAEKRK
ncbi:MAG: nucleoside deaminase [Bacteroidales bacterium]|jgi:tRNA(adenine34) deaminase|nr:nucleoside deaminase [Bacteroidales bacterium]